MSRSPTSSRFKNSSQKFDVESYELNLCREESDQAVGIESLRIALYSLGSPAVLEILLQQERKAHLFEYTMSIIDDSMTSMMREALLTGLVEIYDNSSPSASVLNRLSRFFFFLDFPAEIKPSSLDEDFRFAEESVKALDCLSRAKLGRYTTELTPVNEDEERSDTVKVTKAKHSQKQLKAEKRSRRNTISIDEKPFSALNERVPSTELEAHEFTSRVCAKRQEVLGRFIDLLRHPKLSDTIQELFLPTNVQADDPVPALHAVDKLENPVSVAKTDESTSAYPNVLPYKASLFFDSAKGFGPWRIYMSTAAISHLRGHRKKPKTFNIILKKIRELSNSHFSADNQKRLKGPSNGVPVYEAKMTGDLRLVYQVDLVSDFESQRESQAIRVYGIFTHAQMDNRMWESLSAQLATKGTEYRRRINFRQKSPDANKIAYIPQSWPDISEMENHGEDTTISALVKAADLESLHQWLVLEKYSAFSKELLTCIQVDAEVDPSPVFVVSPYERDIIQHPSSCYVLGRSGTGKTTTMAFKIFGIERMAQMQPNKLHKKPRQLFVTQSRVLANRVKDYYAKLSGFLMAASGAYRSLSSEDDEAQNDEGLGDPEEDDDWQSSLPKKFSGLEDSHFPLFLTFDRLCQLLEADLGVSFARSIYTKEHKHAEKRFDLAHVANGDELEEPETDLLDSPTITNAASSDKKATRSSRVTFETFCGDYWPHFPQNLTKNLDPSLVFGELIGVIKGAEESLKSENKFLSRDEYLCLSARTRSTFASQRETVYAIFEKYMEWKQQYGDYDLADRIHVLIRRMSEVDYNLSVDFLYVDEAQDNLIVDAFLLRRLCCNPHGLFWAGDTAQTIAVGSSFRFDNLKAALHVFERKLYPSLSEKAIVKPEFFQLTTSYRSHGGIVDCAALVIDLITYFWPYSIDALKKESGVVNGSKPIFITGWNEGTARYEQFLRGENGNPIEFGAQQCILVRNDRARDDLRKQVGEIGLILTLYESKGLEFDDVLLYNFFEDSPCNLSQWRSILGFDTSSIGNTTAVPRFDEVRHAGICTELKFLYVAVTRARKNLWIYDQSRQGEPMKTLLVQMGRVIVRTPENAPKLAVSSTPEQWGNAGKQLFISKRYPQAMHCFEQAGLPLERIIAEAYYLRHQAKNIPRSTSAVVRNKAFVKAAKTFFHCAEDSPVLQKRKYYRISADCFRDAQDYGQAGLSYERAEDFTEAAKHYRKADMFVEAVRVIQSRKDMVDPAVARRIVGASRLHYIRVERPHKAIKLFDSVDDALELMKDLGFQTARAIVLEALGKWEQAAELYFLEGQPERAVRLLLKDAENSKAAQRAAGYILETLWQRFPFGVETGIERRSVGTTDWLSLARTMDKTALTPEVKEELSMFDAINRKDRVALFTSYDKFLQARNRPATVLILDHLLRGPTELDSTQTVIRYLQACLVYVDTLREVLNDPTLVDKSGIQKLFGFRKASEDDFLLLKGSLLAECALGDQHVSHRLTEAGEVIFSRHKLLQAMESSTIKRLRTVVEAQVITCSDVRNKLFGDPCPSHIIQGPCTRTDCYRQHIDLRTADATWFNTRVRIHLLQIRFIQTASFALESSYRLRLESVWLTNLYNILNPPHLALGSISSVSPDKLPELNECMRAVAIWIEARALRIDPNRFSSRWFLNVIFEVVTLGLNDDRIRASGLIRRAGFYTGEGFRAYNNLIPPKIPELVNSLDMLDPDFLVSGCVFIRNVVECRPTVDVGYMCQLIEHLCAGAVVLFKNSATTSFHNCLLPRSWLAYVLPRVNLWQEYNFRVPIWRLLQHSADLAHQLVTSRDDNEISHLRGAKTYVVRIISVQRICRAICLLGYNTTWGIRDLVVQSINRLRGASTQPFHRLLRPYFQSRGWPGLRDAAEMSVPSTGLDELVQLVRIGSILRDVSHAGRVKHISFKGRDELLSLFVPAREGATSKLSASAPAIVPRSVPLPSINAVEDEEPAADVGIDEFPVEDTRVEENGDQEDEQEEPFDPQDELVIDDDPPTHAEATAETSKEEIAARKIQQFVRAVHYRKAARKILRWYMAIHERRKLLRDPGIRGKRARFHMAFESSAGEKEWSTADRRFIYVRVIPRLLVCLDALQAKVQLEKDRAKKGLKLNLKNAKFEYENIDERLTWANDNWKYLDHLKKQIDVGSKWHAERTFQDLRDVVFDISERLVGLNVVGVEDDIQLAIAAVEPKQARPTERRQERPTLNVDDKDSYYHTGQNFIPNVEEFESEFQIFFDWCINILV